jgi:MFS family permease
MSASERRRRLGRDYQLLWLGQSMSALGNAVTTFAIPLIVVELTHSAVSLALVTVVQYVPWLLFGLFAGAWVDRTDRKRAMIGTDVARAITIASVPALALSGHLPVAWLYVVAFVSAALETVFEAGQFTAVPSLVESDDLVAANGRLQAGGSAASVAGPVVAGLLLIRFSVVHLLVVDALTFLCSVVTLLLIRRSFEAEPSDEPVERTSLLADVMEGLRYVLTHPVLRAISIMMLIVNFFAATITAQIVLLARQNLHAGDSGVSYLFAAGSIGTVLLTLSAARLRRRFSFGVVALGALVCEGAAAFGIALTHSYWAALPLWGLFSGSAILFNVTTFSFRQAIVPSRLLGRVITVAGVMAWSIIPLGAVAGGLAIERTDLTLVYAAAGLAIVVVALAFGATPIARAERYLPSRSAVTDA